jgi:ribosomal protein S14
VYLINLAQDAGKAARSCNYCNEFRGIIKCVGISRASLRQLAPEE